MQVAVPHFKQQAQELPDPLAAVPRRRTGQAIREAMQAEVQQAWGQVPLPSGVQAVPLVELLASAVTHFMRSRRWMLVPTGKTLASKDLSRSASVRQQQACMLQLCISSLQVHPCGYPSSIATPLSSSARLMLHAVPAPRGPL